MYSEPSALFVLGREATKCSARRSRDEAREINDSLDRAYTLQRINEACLEAVLYRLEEQLEPKSQLYWLLTARILEAGILCAGEYADHAEHRAVGDLLVNPRKISIHFADGSWTVKERHTRLSDTFSSHGEDWSAFMERFSRQATLRTQRPPLLPHLAERLRGSGCIASEYLDHVNGRLEQLGSTLSFLWAWSLEGAEDMFHLQQNESAKRLRFVKQNLCRFDPHLFLALGDMVRGLCAKPGQRPAHGVSHEDGSPAFIQRLLSGGGQCG